MITIVDYKPAFQSLDCAVLFGARYIKRLIDDSGDGNELIGRRILQLGWRGHQHWIVLGRLGIIHTRVMKDVTYSCPWTKNRFFWWYPVALLLEHRYKYEGGIDLYPDDDMSQRVGYESNCLTSVTVKDAISGSIIRSMMGHGYTIGTLPSDGHGKIVPALVDLSNGDQLLVACWVWYNK